MLDNNALWWGAFAFGMVIGWVTYRALRRSNSNGISDIAAVIAAVGGSAVTALFPAGTVLFAGYCVGLAVGFFLYLLVSILLAQAGDPGKVTVWLGESPPRPRGGGGGRGGEGDLPDA
jgi:hypothetical protein